MRWLLGALLVPALVLAPIMGFLLSPLAPFWLSGRTTIPVAGAATGWQFSGAADPSLPTSSERVSDAQRYALARTVGFTPEQAVIATAIAIAENGAGDPRAISSTDDVGVWQINRVHWERFGGRDALYDPLRNAQAAFVVHGMQGWAAWTTYRNDGYRQFLERARNAVAGAQQPEGPFRLESDALFAAAAAWFGVPYLFAGCSRSGIDCSCWTQTIARQLGYSLPRTAQQQYDATTRVAQPQVGDLVFFERTYSSAERVTHVGFYAGDGVMLSAAEPMVGRQSLSNPFWKSRLVGYGRMRGAPGNQG